MAKEEKESAQAAPKEAGDAAQAGDVKHGKKSGMPRLIIFGVAGLALLGGISYGTLHFLGKNKASESSTEQPVEKSADSSIAHNTSDEAATHHEDSIHSEALPLIPDSMSDSARELENMLKAIEFADQQAQSESEAATAAPEEKAQDSIEQSGWLQQEKHKLASRETELNKRQRDIEASEQRLSQKILKIEQASAERIASVAKLYDGMEPDAVAKLMANLDDTTIVAVLPRMKQKNASLVLSLMPPPRAAYITKQIINLASE